MGLIRTRIAVVLKLMDTLTEQPVAAGRVRVQVEQQNQVIWKEDSYVVILERQGVEQLSISILSGFYKEKKLEIDLRGVDNSNIFYIWLMPSENYPFEEGTAMLRGTCPGKKLWLVRSDSSSQLRLMADCEKGSLGIRLWGTGDVVENKFFLLREGKQEELICLQKEDEENEYGYRLAEKTKAAFHRGKAEIYPVIEVEPDDSRHFFVPFQKLPEEGITLEICTEKGKRCEERLLPGEKKEISIRR